MVISKENLMPVFKTVDRTTAELQWYESVCCTRRETIARQVLNCRWHGKTAAEREKERNSKERPIAVMHVRVSARATKEESRCEVRPTLSPSKCLTTFRPAPRTSRSVAGLLGERLRKELGRGEGKVPGDDGSF